MPKLILMRHGQSLWNLRNLFSGWVDIPLSQKGVEEAFAGGKQIMDEPIDLIFTSALVRSMMTAMLAMTHHHSGKTPVVMHQGEGHMQDWGKIYSKVTEELTIPVVRAWELNERCYGELQGCNKAELSAIHGVDQIKIWRRSFDIPPPGGESLKMTAERTLPYFENSILPELKAGKNVFIVAHGNSLRSIMMKLDKLNEQEIIDLELLTGQPVIYSFENNHFTKQHQ